MRSGCIERILLNHIQSFNLKTTTRGRRRRPAVTTEYWAPRLVLPHWHVPAIISASGVRVSVCPRAREPDCPCLASRLAAALPSRNPTSTTASFSITDPYTLVAGRRPSCMPVLQASSPGTAARPRVFKFYHSTDKYITYTVALPIVSFGHLYFTQHNI